MGPSGVSWLAPDEVSATPAMDIDLLNPDAKEDAMGVKTQQQLHVNFYIAMIRWLIHHT